MEQVQTDLNHGKSVAEIADTQKVKPDTIQKAIQDGRLKRLSDEGEKKKEDNTTLTVEGDTHLIDEASHKSERNAIDAECAMGMGATQVVERVYASAGLLTDGVGPPILKPLRACRVEAFCVPWLPLWPAGCFTRHTIIFRS